MHPSADATAQAVAIQYVTRPGLVVVDVGGRDVNGSMRPHFEARGAKYISVDMEAHPSVDVVTLPGEPIPLATGSVDIVVSSSCFEHDPMFWLTFKECCRLLKEGGILFISAPSNGHYHQHPGDNWRFYTDAAQALAVWSGTPFYSQQNIEAAIRNTTTLEEMHSELRRGGNIYPVEVEEQFFAGPFYDEWIDCNMIFKRIAVPRLNAPITIDRSKLHGPVRQLIRDAGIPAPIQPEAK